jgi:predicted PurR-regulated permease PerM
MPIEIVKKILFHDLALFVPPRKVRKSTWKLLFVRWITVPPGMWALVASLASLLPLVGTGIVWLPGAVVLLASGHWIKALLLFGWGVAVVAQVDALVRPYVVSGRAKMHKLLIFFALLGGVRAFGFMGIFVGPVVVSVTVVLLGMIRESNALSQEADRPEATT